MVTASVLADTIEELMERLSSPLTALTPKVKQQLADMKEPLSEVHDFVHDMNDEDRGMSQAFDRWLEGVEDSVDDLDDLLDELSTEARSQQMVVAPDNIISKVCNLFPSLTYCYRMNIESDIGEVRKRLRNLESSSLGMAFGAFAEMAIELTTKDAQNNDVIGRKAEKEKIIEYILDTSCNDYHPQIIAVVGLEGIGKTTLANMVYKDGRVSNHFDDELRVWADLSDSNSDLKSIVRNLVKSEETTEAQDLGEVKELVQRKIDRRWLLVVDGAESEKYDVLRDLLQVLPGGPSGSKILVTTRSKAVAQMATRTVPHFVLTGLSKRDAWSLFKKHAFKEEPKQRDPRKLVVGKEIVKKCEGKPGTIIFAASYLSSVDSLEGWLSFNNSFSIFFAKTQLPSSADDVIFTPLKRKFDKLPSNLKQCLAYSALLPRGKRIDVQTLCKLWMAQGFNKTALRNRRRDMEEERLYYSYTQALWQGGFFQDAQFEFGTARSCRMQDDMHDHAFHVAQGKIILMDPYGERMHGRVRHVTLDFNLDTSWQIPDSLLKASRLRTILLSGQTRLPHEEKLSMSTCNAIISRFKRLRVLDLHDLGMKQVPNSLGKLKHLRYLDLSKNSFAALPRSTTRLLNLQTLKLSDCYKLKELPEGIDKLVNLRNLEIDGCFALTHMPPGLGKLASLQTLSSFVVSTKYNSEPANIGGLGELNNLNNLRGELEISHLELLKHDTPPGSQAQTQINSFLDQKQYLERLTLRWDREAYDDDDWDNDDDHDEILLKCLQPHENLKALSIMGFKGDKFSSWVFSLSHLVKLSLYNCPRCQFLPSLHKLTTLEILELERMEDLEYIADFEEFSSSSESETTPLPPFFPSLKRIILWDCPDLISWWKTSTATRPGTAPLLSKIIWRLDILFCPKLTPLPFYPKHLFLVCNSVNQLEQMMMKMAEPSSSSSNGLKSLIIKKFEELTSLPEEGLKDFTSLQDLHIDECHKLTSLSEGLQHLSSLQRLTIENCSELVLSKDEDDGMRWKGLRSLRSLTIMGIPKLKALPLGLSHATSLKELQLSSCPGLMSLPEWIDKLTLDTLKIEDCLKLLPRCQRETGEDWPKISKIPHRSVK